MEKEYRIRPYYKSELAEAYAPFLTTNSALNRLALWIDLNPQLSQALAQTGYRDARLLSLFVESSLVETKDCLR